MDICQSVFAAFYVRVAGGQYDLREPRDIVRLLVTMARNKVREKARKLYGAARERRPLEGGPVPETVPDSGDSPSQVVADSDLLAEVLRRLPEEERALARQRAEGREWADLAVEYGRGPDALRKQFARALGRVLGQLGLAGEEDEAEGPT